MILTEYNEEQHIKMRKISVMTMVLMMESNVELSEVLYKALNKGTQMANTEAIKT